MADNGGRTGAAWRALCRDLRARTKTCGLCGGALDTTLKYPHPQSFTVEHIVPIAHGGHLLDRMNVVGAHLHCNVSSGATVRATVTMDMSW